MENFSLKVLLINLILSHTKLMKYTKLYSEFIQENHKGTEVSLDELEERIEQKANEEEADNIMLAEDKRVPD